MADEVYETALWDDNPTAVDLLGFSTVAAPMLTALGTPDIDPVTIGIHGPWGSGKSTVLKLLEAEFSDMYVVIPTSPWEYEDHEDVKGTLIGEVLRALEERAQGEQTWAKNARKTIEGLAKRVSWSRVGMAVAKGAVTRRFSSSTGAPTSKRLRYPLGDPHSNGPLVVLGRSRFARCDLGRRVGLRPKDQDRSVAPRCDLSGGVQIVK